MCKLINIIRSVLFNLFYVFWSFFIPFLGLPTLLYGRKLSVYVAKIWARGVVVGAKYICGIDYEIEGRENLPEEPFIVASEHQSAWETAIFFVLFKSPSYVLKKELSRIPVFGWFLDPKTEMINIDRKGGAKSLKTMLKYAKEYIRKGNIIVIYPQGTRVAYGEEGQIFSGVASLYNLLPDKLVPVSLDSGKYWGRNSFMKSPGTIKLKFWPPLPKGLSPQEVVNKLSEIYYQKEEK